MFYLELYFRYNLIIIETETNNMEIVLAVNAKFTKNYEINELRTRYQFWFSEKFSTEFAFLKWAPVNLDEIKSMMKMPENHKYCMMFLIIFKKYVMIFWPKSRFVINK